MNLLNIKIDRIVRLGELKIFFYIFIFSLSFKTIIIYLTPYANTHFVDLNIYIDGGQLITNNINPYDFQDNILLRNKLRLDDVAKNNLTSASQDSWNKYASGNLPLSLLFYGLADSISTGNPIVYRLLFAFFDSILCGFIFIFIFFNWINQNNKKRNLFIGIGLGLGSAFLFYDGLLIAEDKGTQILLMLMAIYFSYKRKFIYSALFLSFSISFKGLGVFILPLCIFYLFGNTNQNIFPIIFNNYKKVAIYLFLVFVICSIFFIPFGIKPFEMIFNRISDASTREPMQSSIWVIPYLFFNKNYIFIKYLIIIIFSIVNIYGFMVKKLSLEILTCSFLLLFVALFLTAGSMNRINMSILTSIVLIGYSKSDFDKYNLLSYYYIIGGWVCFIGIIILRFALKSENWQIIEGLFSLIFMLIYFRQISFQIISNDARKTKTIL